MTPAVALWVGVYWCAGAALQCGAPYTVHDSVVGPTYFLTERSCMAEARQRADQASADYGHDWKFGCVPQRDGQIIAGSVKP